MIIIDEDPMGLMAEEGMILTNGEIYSTLVYLGKYDSPENWHEIPIEDMPPEPEEEEP